MDNFQILILSVIFLLFISCKKEEPEEEKMECYRCTYAMGVPNICDEDWIFEICDLGQHHSSLQSNLEIKEICGSEVITTEDIDFIEDLVAIHTYQGANCEAF